MELQRLKFLMDVQEKIDEWSKKLPPEDTNLVKAKEQFFRLVTTEFEKITPKNELQDSSKVSQIAFDTNTIRQALEIRADISVNFDFIDVERVKNQLIIDNLRMENARLDIQKPDLDRFYEFCVNAFYQVEELINYYYGKKFTFEELIIHFTQKNNRFQKRNNVENISHIDIAVKAFVFTNSSNLLDFNSDKDREYVYLVNNLRELRNEDSHRCNIILNSNLEKLHRFVKERYNNYHKIRQLIVRICEVIKKDLGK